MLDYNLFKPIRNFGLLIIILGTAGLACLFTFSNDSDFYFAGKIFIGIVSFFHLFIGYNIISRNKMGFACLKLYLYLMYPSFPLGYFYAKKAFEYIKTNNIKKFYDKTIMI